MKNKFPAFLSVFLCLLVLILAPAAGASEEGIQKNIYSVAESVEDPAYLFVWDTAGILSSSEAASLQEEAAVLAQTYQYGCYIVTVKDYRLFDSYGMFPALQKIYNDLGLGLGSRKNGIVLMLSMDDRDYYVAYHPDTGNPVFTDYGAESLDPVFLDNFKNNDWYGGFSDYVAQCGKYMKMASEGTIFDEDTDPARAASRRMLGLLVGGGLGAALGLLFCGISASSMKTAREASDADLYTIPGSARITARQDRFTNRTTSRRHIEKSSGGGGGGGSSHSGGFSGHGGKF